LQVSISFHADAPTQGSTIGGSLW